MSADTQTPVGGFPPDWRALCEELVNALDAWQLGGSPLEDEVEQRLIDRTRAALARWGRPAPAPAEGEVADEARYLVKELRDQADDLSPSLELFGLIHRAADLLEQRHPTPVPVSERLPEPDDCDAEGRCWWLHVGEDGVGDWFQRAPYPSITSYAFFRMTHWLPSTALPLPSGEVAE